MFTFICRPRRRSGSSIVVVDTQDPEPTKPQEEEDAYNTMMMTLDNGPHREMAVDVPDSFIARSKTPPRYPPPRPQCRNGSAPKPVPPPRDHLRIEKDGRLVNRAPAPQVPARTPGHAVPTPTNSVEQKEPTKEQLDSIRKFQVSLLIYFTYFICWSKAIIIQLKQCFSLIISVQRFQTRNL